MSGSAFLSRAFGAGAVMVLAAGVLAASPSRPPARAPAVHPDAAPCEGVAAQARRLGDARWASEGTAAVEGLVEMTPAAPAQSPAEAQVAIQASVRRALGLADGFSRVEVRRLPGTDILEASHVSGTAACQSLAFVRSRPGGAAEILPSPPLKGELCGSSYAHVGRVGARPALIQVSRSGRSAGEANAAREPLVSLRVTPWTGSGWGRACEVSFLLQAERRLSDRLCARPADCQAFETTAQVLAAAFNRTKAQDALYRRPPTPVRYDLNPPPSSTQPMVGQVRGQLARTQRDLPMFGKTPAIPVMPGFSGDELDIVPTQVDGRWMVAAIGFPGIGWRQDRDVTLVTIYEPGKAATPKATYIFRDGVAGLESAKVSVPGD